MKVKILKKVIAILCASVMTTTTIVPAGAVSLTRDLCNNEEKTKVFEIAQNVNDKLEAIENSLKELDNTILSVKSNTFKLDTITEATKSQEAITFEKLNYWKNAIIKRIADVNNITVGDLEDLEFLSKNLNCFFAYLDNFKKNITKKQSLNTDESKKFLTNTLAELYAQMKDFKNNTLDLVLKKSKTSNEIYDSLLIDETLKFMKKEKDLYDNIRFNYGHIIDKNLELKNQFNVLKKNAETCLNFGEKKSSSEIIKQLNENINDWNKFKERVEEQNEKEKQKAKEKEEAERIEKSKQLEQARKEAEAKKRKLEQTRDLKSNIENFQERCNTLINYDIKTKSSNTASYQETLSTDFANIEKPYGLTIRPILSKAAKFLYDTIKEQNELSIDDIKSKINILNDLTKEIQKEINSIPSKKEESSYDKYKISIKNLKEQVDNLIKFAENSNSNDVKQKYNEYTEATGKNNFVDEIEEQVESLENLCKIWKKQDTILLYISDLTKEYIKKYYFNEANIDLDKANIDLDKANIDLDSDDIQNISHSAFSDILCTITFMKSFANNFNTTNNIDTKTIKEFAKFAISNIARQNGYNWDKLIDSIKEREIKIIYDKIGNKALKFWHTSEDMLHIVNDELKKNDEFLTKLLEYRYNEWNEKNEIVNKFLNQFGSQLDAHLYNNISNTDSKIESIIDYTKKIDNLDNMVIEKFKEIFNSKIFENLN